MLQKSDPSPSAQSVGAVKPQGPRLRVEASPAGNGDDRLGSSRWRVRNRLNLPRIDGMTVEELRDYLHVHWPGLREELLASLRRTRTVMDFRRRTFQIRSAHCMRILVVLWLMCAMPRM